MSLPIPAQVEGPRRTSSTLSFLRRSKSKEHVSERNVSGSRKTLGGRLTKKQPAEPESDEAHAAGNQPLKLPEYLSQSQSTTFASGTFNPDSIAFYSNQARKMSDPGAVEVGGRTVNNKLSPSHPNSSREPVDPYARSESMTHRGRSSYANSLVSTINNPRRVRRRKDPTPFNVLVIGARNSGKSSFVDFLKASLAMPAKKNPLRAQEDVLETRPPPVDTNHNFVNHYLETEIDGERVGVTLWDSQGLEKTVVDLQLRDVSSFLQSKFEDTFAEEMKVVRTPGARDTHIHCVFFILDPMHLEANVQAAKQTLSDGIANGKYNTSARIIGGLDEDFDLQVLRALHGKTTVVPVISKADTITTAHMAFLKKTVSDSLRKAGINPLEVLSLDGEDEDDDNSSRLDERDEDEENARIAKSDGDGTPRDDGSDVVPVDLSPSNSKQDASSRHKSTASVSSFQTMEEHLPLSILSPDSYSLNPLDGPVGRTFPWGFADPYNTEHCDFLKLKENCFGEWRAELREASRDRFYEKWRTNRLGRKGPAINGAGRAAEKKGGIPNGILKVRT